jgi:site-specific recombinase XerD
VIRAFRLITKKAGLGEDWVPREMRHTFVSVLSANGVPVESIALLTGHDRTATTESVYRKSRELHQPGEKLQVSSSQDRRNGVPLVLMPAL